jgi:hypothetical protein
VSQEGGSGSGGGSDGGSGSGVKAWRRAGVVVGCVGLGWFGCL